MLRTLELIRRFLFYVCSFCWMGHAIGQANVDSLIAVLDKSVEPELRIKLANDVSRGLAFRNADSARYFAKLAIEEARTLDNKEPLAKGYYNLGLAFHVQNQSDSAESNYRKSLEFRAAIKDKSLLAGLSNNLGAIYGQKGSFEQALIYYLESLDLKLESGNYLAAASTLNNIGIIKFDQELYDEALVYYQRAIKLDEQEGNKMGLARSTGNVGLTFLEMEAYDSALFYYRLAYDIIDPEDVNCLKMYATNGLGQTHFARYELTDAAAYAKMALEEAQGCSDPVIQSSASTLLGKIALARRNYATAEALLLEGHRLAEQNDMRQELSEVKEVLFNFYKEQGQTRKSLYYLESLMQLKDSLFNEGLTKKLVTLELNHAFEQEKDSINFRVEQEKVAYEAEIKRRNILIVAVGIALLLAIGIVWMYRRANDLKQEANQLLSEKNKVVTEALAQKEELFKEMHHRVKNNLQIVSSLLSVQARLLKDEKAVNAMKETKSRVISMALVHQHLYQQKSDKHVNVETYLESLIDSINQSFGSNLRAINIVMNIDRFQLDSDRAINLGFIFNELITNAYKHAFPDDYRGKPRIDIKLKKRSDDIQLLISDNGVGLKEEIASKSYGMNLIASITSRMDGHLKYSNGVGTTISLSFPYA